MTYASVLVHVQATEGAERVACASHVARRFGATLVGLGSQGLPAILDSDPWGMASAQLIRDLINQIDQNMNLAEAAFLSGGEEGARVWRTGPSAPTEDLLRYAATVDLLVVSLTSDRDIIAQRAADAGQVIVSAGRPVLLAPEGKTTFDPDTVVVAWKNAREARRATADAMPFLKSAREVILLVVGDLATRDEDMAIAEDVAANLRRHGAPARTLWEGRADDRAAEVILACAAHNNAGLIVAGAYGHSRLGEWVFGGVTRSLLNQTDRFVLFSH